MNDKAIAVNADWVEQIFDGRGAGSIDTTTGKECPALRTSSKRSLVALGQAGARLLPWWSEPTHQPTPLVGQSGIPHVVKHAARNQCKTSLRPLIDTH